MKRSSISHEFVEFVPSELKEGVLYVSVQYATAVHKCACGCGHKCDFAAYCDKIERDMLHKESGTICFTKGVWETSHR
jgi:hypothetical protein